MLTKLKLTLDRAIHTINNELFIVLNSLNPIERAKHINKIVQQLEDLTKYMNSLKQTKKENEEMPHSWSGGFQTTSAVAITKTNDTTLNTKIGKEAQPSRAGGDYIDNQSTHNNDQNKQ